MHLIWTWRTDVSGSYRQHVHGPRPFLAQGVLRVVLQTDGVQEQPLKHPASARAAVRRVGRVSSRAARGGAKRRAAEAGNIDLPEASGSECVRIVGEEGECESGGPSV